MLRQLLELRRILRHRKLSPDEAGSAQGTEASSGDSQCVPARPRIIAL